MISVIDHGQYKLLETRDGTKILVLNEVSYAWVYAGNIGEILVASKKTFSKDALLCAGSYRLYKVKDEKEFSDLLHLELSVGYGMWQGYLLPTGLPTALKRRSRFIPTKEIITRSIPLHDFV